VTQSKKSGHLILTQKSSRVFFMEKRLFVYTLIALSIMTALYFGLMLGERPFATPDEARYVEIPREMVVSGDFITPRLNGVKYFEKPPLFYWLQAGAMKAFGSSEFSMRLVTALMAVGGVVATFAFAASFYGLMIGAVAALIVATSPLYFGLAHMILLDMSASIFVTFALFSFYKAFTATHRRRLWFWGFAAACGLGVMTKGLMALAIPGPIIVTWLTATRQWGRLRPFYPLSALAIFLSIVVPWHVAVSLQNPEFAHKYFIVEHFLRFTTSYHERYQPIWFFIPIVLIGLFPWISFIPRGVKNLRQDPLTLYLLLWAAWVIAFFSVGNSKLIPYILPAFPPLAILLAHGWGILREQQRYIWLPAVTLVLGAIAFFLLPYFMPLDPIITQAIQILGMACVLGALLAAWRPTLGLLALGCVALTINVMTLVNAPLIQKPSVKSLLATVPLRAEDRLVSYRVYFQDLPVYAQRLVTVVSAKGELAFGCCVEDTSAWMIEEAEFLRLWESQERLWAVMKPGEFEDFRAKNSHFFIQIYRQTPFYVLVVNKETENQ
jgi:4-amino-4-deoxy-L-arabinose transferase-like glycosyltransferase